MSEDHGEFRRFGYERKQHGSSRRTFGQTRPWKNEKHYGIDGREHSQNLRYI